MKYISMTDAEYNFMLEGLAQKTRLLIGHIQDTALDNNPAEPTFVPTVFKEARKTAKKVHWTQTPAGKKKLAARKRSKK